MTRIYHEMAGRDIICHEDDGIHVKTSFQNRPPNILQGLFVYVSGETAVEAPLAAIMVSAVFP